LLDIVTPKIVIRRKAIEREKRPSDITSGFGGLRDKTLDHKICGIAKSNLPKHEGRFLEVLLWVHISRKGNRRAIVESSSGQWRRKGPVYMDF
jgi:hypothetical protein